MADEGQIQRWVKDINSLASVGDTIERAGKNRDLRAFGSYILPITVVDVVHGALCYSIGICCDGGCIPAKGGKWLKRKVLGLPWFGLPIVVYCKIVTVPRLGRKGGVWYDERIKEKLLGVCCPPQLAEEFLGTEGIPD